VDIDINKQMSLEDQQFQHDMFQANKNNSSGSNDPQQIKNDLTELLITGAKVAAKGRENGLTLDETVNSLNLRVEERRR